MFSVLHQSERQLQLKFLSEIENPEQGHFRAMVAMIKVAIEYIENVKLTQEVPPFDETVPPRITLINHYVAHLKLEFRPPQEEQDLLV